MSLVVTDPLIGRERELEVLCRLLGRVTRGSTATAVIEGEAGVGKTRLLAGLTEAARGAGVTVLHGAAHPLERTRPFGPLVDALRLRPGSGDRRRAAIGRLLWGDEEAVQGGALMPGQVQFRVVEEIIDLLERLSDQGPVVLALDDLHWAESATLLAVRWITRRLTAVPLLVVATVRPAPQSPELVQLLDDVAQSSATFVRLGALPQGDVEALVEARLGVPPGPAVADAVRRAGGNPLWVVELLRSLQSEGRIDLSGDRAELRAGGLPGSIRQLVARRLGYLPESTVRALHTASLFGESFSLNDMAVVTGRRVTELVDDLGPAFAAELVTDRRGVLVFRHQLVRDAIYEEIPAAARVALHREIADALAAAGAPLEKVATHLMLGAVAPDPAAAASLRLAAAEAAARAPGVAVELLRCAESLLPAGDPERDPVLAELVGCLSRIGHTPEATAIAEGVLGRPHAATVDRPLRIALIGALSVQRRGAELIPYADAVLEAASEIPIAEQAHVLGLCSLGRQFDGELIGGEADARRGLALAERAGDRAMISWNSMALGAAVKVQGRYGDALQATSRAVEFAFAPPNLEARLRMPHMMHGMALSDADRLSDAAEAFRTAAEECATLEDSQLVADIQLGATEVRLLQGQWEQAVPEIEGGIPFARENGNLNMLPRCHAYLAIIAAFRGDVTTGEKALAPFAGELTSDRPCFGAEFVFYAASLLAEVGGHRATALEHLQRFWEHDAERDNRYGHRFIAPALTRLALALGQPELARNAASGAELAAELAGGVPSVQSAALRCRGMTDRDPALMVEAVALAHRSGRVLEHAGACEDAASVLAAGGDAPAARALLEQAIARYDTLGALWVLARATACHRALGGRRGSRGSRTRALTGVESLTRSEHAVAELVAEGLTNREIGARLFISPHTVNNHLRRAFQKLDVSTRAGLAAKVSGGTRGLSTAAKT
jgi:DNA-binding CsgD family transcriptional regulator